MEKLVSELAAVAPQAARCHVDGISFTSGADSAPDVLDATQRLQKRILRAAYPLMTRKGAPRLQICSARFILRAVAAAAAVAGSSGDRAVTTPPAAAARRHARRLKQLQPVSRLLFNLSKDKSNDRIFREESVLHALLQLLSGEERSKEKETKSGSGSGARTARVRFPLAVLIYATGTLKNVSISDAANQGASRTGGGSHSHRHDAGLQRRHGPRWCHRRGKQTPCRAAARPDHGGPS